MNAITMADCQIFLAEKFILAPDSWKRLRKFDDVDGNPTHEFSHPDSEDKIFLVERNGALHLTSHNASSINKKCSKYTFCVTGDATPDAASGFFWHTVMIDSEYVTWPDEEIPIILGLFPKDWVVKCEMEEEFSIFTPLSQDELIVALHDLGFKSHADYDDINYGRSALTSPTILARQQRKHLREAVGGNTAVSAPPSKM